MLSLYTASSANKTGLLTGMLGEKVSQQNYWLGKKKVQSKLIDNTAP